MTIHTHMTNDTDLKVQMVDLRRCSLVIVNWRCPVNSNARSLICGRGSMRHTMFMCGRSFRLAFLPKADLCKVLCGYGIGAAKTRPPEFGLFLLIVVADAVG